ncbi:ATP-dependent DNA helicase II subunit 1 [Neolecta irregularis DAH-3]|uniref:ATP-dependent DNA helicase II subunit 1 n=1 Tax=Neolecta irregularis (strain DAH-3) TaxID=1198029 RepID=A0A1U7LLM7_NEOID|nr:ATP-dependent DNA helicase II subunit 1 [Neolecta irregularis DAH-3]|eukprot:OLL23564.1 ATP-dependent DNA helicase II subunit 1 [Neolecta irregularis DAH-3]
MAADRIWEAPEFDLENIDSLTEDDLQYQNMKDAVIFAIHVSDSMLNTSESQPVSPLRIALDSAYKFMLQKVISSPNDMVGILLFGTEQTRPKSNNKNEQGMYLLMELDQMDAPRIHFLKDLLEDDTELSSIARPTGEPFYIAYLLSSVSNIFSTAPNYNSKRLFLVTDNDNPMPGNEKAKMAAITRGKDFSDLGIRIEPFFISTVEKLFDSSKFYENIIYPDPDNDEDDDLEDAVFRFEHLFDRIRSKQTPRRILFDVPLELGSGFRIGVNGYLRHKKQLVAKSCNVYTKGEVAVQVATETIRISADTTKVLTPEEIKLAFPFGHKDVMVPIVFTAEELKKLRTFRDPVIKILCFRPLSHLEPWQNTRPSYFLYPNETKYIGSIRTFAALHYKLIHYRKKQDGFDENTNEVIDYGYERGMAIVLFIPRRNSNPVLGALIPCEEIKLKNGMQKQPAGIYLIPLPFRDDIRDLPAEGMEHAPEVLIERMRDILNGLVIRYEPSKYSNPGLQRHYQVLQAMALEEEPPANIEDSTLPKYKIIKKRTGPLIATWKSELDKHVPVTSTHSQPEVRRLTNREMPLKT